MNNSIFFPLLNLPRLKAVAQIWAQRYPAINRLTLYCSQSQSNLASYIVTAEVEQFKEEYAQKGAFLNDWEQSFHPHLLKDLRHLNIYKDATTYIKREDWFFYLIKEKKEDFPFTDDIITDSAFLLYERTEKKPRASSIHKEQVRKVAMDIWREDPTMIYGDIYKHEKMKKLFKTFLRPKPYVKKTISGWISDLNPDRSGGRPKKSPAVKNKQSKKYTLRKIENNNK